MGSVKVDTKGLEEFAKRMQQLDVDYFCEQAAKELAKRFLAKVIKRTPVGQYDDGRVGGTLRRGWTTQESGSGSEGLKTTCAGQFVDTLKVHQFGGTYVIEIKNPVEYASYVEYGHRQEPGRFVPALGKRLKKSWVPGQFMMTITENEIKKNANKIVEAKFNKLLKEAFK